MSEDSGQSAQSKDQHCEMDLIIVTVQHNQADTTLVIPQLDWGIHAFLIFE